MISVNLANSWKLYQGPDRYTMPIFLLQHEPLEKKLLKLGKKYYDKIKRVKENGTEDSNSQKTHRRWKEKMIDTICQYAKILSAKMDKDIYQLEADRQKILNESKRDNKHKI